MRTDRPWPQRWRARLDYAACLKLFSHDLKRNPAHLKPGGGLLICPVGANDVLLHIEIFEILSHLFLQGRKGGVIVDLRIKKGGRETICHNNIPCCRA